MPRSKKQNSQGKYNKVSLSGIRYKSKKNLCNKIQKLKKEV